MTAGYRDSVSAGRAKGALQGKSNLFLRSKASEVHALRRLDTIDREDNSVISEECHTHRALPRVEPRVQKAIRQTPDARFAILARGGEVKIVGRHRNPPHQIVVREGVLRGRDGREV